MLIYNTDQECLFLENVHRVRCYGVEPYGRTVACHLK